jgi:hypothetical protein
MVRRCVRRTYMKGEGQVTQVQQMRCGCDDCTQGRPCIPAFTPKPVVYSPVMCRCCGGKTREVAPTGLQVGAGAMMVSSFRFLCDDCEVITWRRNS